ncbi:MAG TPA: hypothetical protein VIM36_09170, partial [Gemmatimonadaceae bacterium]
MTTADEPSILVLNVGSSTLKFGLFPFVASEAVLLQGVLTYSGSAPGQLRITDSKGRSESMELAVDRDSAAAELLQYLQRSSLFHSVQSVGHRLVHGGLALLAPVRI